MDLPFSSLYAALDLGIFVNSCLCGYLANGFL